MGGQAVIEIASQTKVQSPVSLGNLVLDVERELLYVRVPVMKEQTSSAREIEWQQVRARRVQGDAIHKAGIAVRIRERREQSVIHNSKVVVLV